MKVELFVLQHAEHKDELQERMNEFLSRPEIGEVKNILQSATGAGTGHTGSNAYGTHLITIFYEPVKPIEPDKDSSNETS